MARLTEEMVVARTRQSDLASVKKLNCWGVELADVSLLRRMPNVEVVVMSINKISTLEDFAHCPRLRELYVRQNKIGDLAEIRHLKCLDELRMLWLGENPCCQRQDYRYTILRNLPNLEKLDDVVVRPEEVEEAMRKGTPIFDPDEEDYQQEEYSQFGQSRDSSPEREEHEYRREQASERSETGAESVQRDAQNNGYRQITQVSPTRSGGYTPEPEDRYEYSQPSRQSHCESTSSTDLTHVERAPNIPHSQSAHSVKQEYSNGSDGPRLRSSPHYRHSADYGFVERSDSYQQIPQRCQLDYESRRERDGDMPSGRRERDGDAPSRRDDAASAGRRERDGDMPSGRRERDGDIASAVMAERRGFTRRPVTRNSNLLSALLCLVKELDYPSLEVAEMAVRCRMDELADQQ